MQHVLYTYTHTFALSNTRLFYKTFVYYLVNIFSANTLNICFQVHTYVRIHVHVLNTYLENRTYVRLSTHKWAIAVHVHFELVFANKVVLKVHILCPQKFISIILFLLYSIIQRKLLSRHSPSAHFFLFLIIYYSIILVKWNTFFPRFLTLSAPFLYFYYTLPLLYSYIGGNTFPPLSYPF